MDIFNFKCKYCGGELNAVDGLKSVGKCKYCGSKQTLPKLENEKRANLFERANHLRRNNEFDKAEALYEQLLNEDLSDPEAYWSLVLCRYGIEYVEDKRTGERLPTVNRMQMTSILGDEDYKSAIANADDEQKALYEEEAKLINEIQKGILEIARKEEPFDIFICYKETDSEGKRSRDSILAQDLYHELTRDGYKVFFARVTLQGKLGSAYEPYIFSALNSAKVMVVLGTKKEHFEAAWVRNEWSRFLGQIKKGERKVLIPAYRDMDAYDLPVEFSNLQALDMSRLGFLQELVEGVENILKSYKKKEAPKAEPAPTYAHAPESPKKKKKSKAPIIVVAVLLALAIAGVAVFASGVLDPFLGSSQTEEISGKETEKPTEKPTDKPTDRETEGLPKEPSDLSYVSVHETMYVDNSEEGYFFVVDGVQHYLEHGVEVLRVGVSFDGEWSKIEYNGMKGYVQSRYLSYDKLVTETESVKETESSEPTDTDEPTGNNVTEPTEAPTDEQTTDAPTEKPTEAPTEKPTEAPTDAPTEAPTEKPTDAPTEKPTDAPTEKPTETPELEVKEPVTSFEEGVAYLGVLAHKNLGKYIYLNGTIDGYYLGAVDNESAAANVYFERAADINYYMYFLEGDAKVYVNMFLNGSYINYALEPTPDTVWHYNETYKCLVANVEGELVFLGTSNTGTYGNFVPKKVDVINDFFVMQLVVSPVQPEQKPDGEPSLEFVFDSATDSYRVVGLGSVTGEKIVIPSTHNGKPVKFIGARAFDTCIDMKSLSVPKSIVYIDDYAFNNCINLVHITYEGSYEEWMEINTSIWGNDSLRNEGMKMDYGQIAADPEPENYDFSFVWAPDGESFYVAGLWEYSDPTNVIIPETHKGLFVTGINDYAFSAQTDITSVFIPSTIKVIEIGAFTGCENLAAVEFEGTADEWRSVSIDSENDMLKNAETTFGATSEGGESGDSEGNVHSVSSADELISLIARINRCEVDSSITIRLESNINMSGRQFIPIYYFTGTIDGNGKTISNIELTEDGMSGNIADGNGATYGALYIGFISTAYDVTVCNLTLDSVTANLETDRNVYIGALAGYAEGLVIEDCTINSNIAVNEGAYLNTSGVAGVIGYSLDSLMQRTEVDATVTHTAQSGESHTGAILGAGNIRIHDCTIDLAVTFVGHGGAGHAGWLIGREYTDASIDCATLQGSTVKGTFSAENCMYTWGAVGQGYLYIRHGEQIDLEAYNKLIYVTSPDEYVEPELPDDSGDGGEEIVTVTVSDATGLVYVIDQINSGAYANNVIIELGDNIDMNGVAFTPIKDFRGVFDGKGYSISNLVLSTSGTTATVRDGNLAEYSATAIGFIASATGATVRNLTLDYVTAEINTSDEIVIGSLIGWAKNVNVVDCSVRSDLNVIVGMNDVSGVSGLIGYVEYGAMIERVTVNSTITCSLGSGESFTGSMVAFSVGTVDIDDCVVDLNVVSTSKGGNGHVGALAGMLYDGYGCSYLYNTVVSGTIESNSGYYQKLVGEGYFCERDYDSPQDEAGLKEYGNVFNIEMITNK